MAALGMYGPYDFNIESIDSTVVPKCPGNYALRYIKERTFYVKRIGRSDTDIQRMLKLLSVNNNYKQFKFCYAKTAKEAFEIECHNYHDFGGSKKLGNVHPIKPSRSTWKCPICYIYD